MDENKSHTANLQKLKRDFCEDMQKYHTERIKRGYTAKQIEDSMKNNREFETAIKYSGTDTTGFENLVKLGLLDFSIEALILQPRYSPLFTEEKLESCKKLLEKYGHKTHL